MKGWVRSADDFEQLRRSADRLKDIVRAWTRGKTVLIDSNIWMDWDYEDALEAIRVCLLCDEEEVQILDSQFEEIAAKKSDPDSGAAARQGLRIIESFQQSGVIEIVGSIRQERTRSYADPDILDYTEKLADAGERVCIITNDRDLRVRIRDSVSEEFVEFGSMGELALNSEAFLQTYALVFDDAEEDFLKYGRIEGGFGGYWGSAFGFVIRSKETGRTLDVHREVGPVKGWWLLKYQEITICGNHCQLWDYGAQCNQVVFFEKKKGCGGDDLLVGITVCGGDRVYSEELVFEMPPKVLNLYLRPESELDQATLVCGRDRYYWRLQPWLDGTYTIEDPKSGFVLGLSDGEDKVGRVIQVQSENELDQQRWWIQPAIGIGPG